VSRPVCQVVDCTLDAAVHPPGNVLGLRPVLVRVCVGHAHDFLEAADSACLDTRLAIARKRS
jgi:hypothetical protein